MTGPTVFFYLSSPLHYNLQLYSFNKYTIFYFFKMHATYFNKINTIVQSLLGKGSLGEPCIQTSLEDIAEVITALPGMEQHIEGVHAVGEAIEVVDTAILGDQLHGIRHSHWVG